MTFKKPTGLVEKLHTYIAEHPEDTRHFLESLCCKEQPLFLRTEISDIFHQLLKEKKTQNLHESPVRTFVQWCQEATIQAPWAYFALRKRVARWIYLRINLETLALEEITTDHFLYFKEKLVTGGVNDRWPLEIDLEPFSREFFKLKEERSIGRGLEFLNRRLSSGLFQDLTSHDNRLLRFLQVHRYKDQQLMLNKAVEDTRQLRDGLRAALRLLRDKDNTVEWRELAEDLQDLGFEPGWGKYADRISDTMGMLLDILEAPSPSALEVFLSRIPMIFSIAIITPHGYFAQEDVLGRPDTGGQVVYILDQAKALEQEMRERLEEQGLSIDPVIVVLTRLIPEAEDSTCDQRIEPIRGTRHSYILRVPFRKKDGEIHPHE